MRLLRIKNFHGNLPLLEKSKLFVFDSLSSSLSLVQFYAEVCRSPRKKKKKDAGRQSVRFRIVSGRVQTMKRPIASKTN